MKTNTKPFAFISQRRAKSPPTEENHYPLGFRLQLSNLFNGEAAGRVRVTKYSFEEKSVFKDEKKNDNPFMGDVFFSNGGTDVSGYGDYF